ncbi:MAG TPA: lipopolysaccharide heptosyltransferase I [Burkholderiaceae bacterium]|nr:lipopolysaccharide heptosyltransferase I [Burkholderiaceae bacterium]
MRVLLVKMSSMGDVVHAQPVAVDIRRHLPQARIDWVVEQPFAAIPAMNEAVDRVIPIAWRKWRRRLRDAEVRRALRDFVAGLRETEYDWVIDCQGLLKSALVSRIARAVDRAGLSWSSAREPLASLAYGRRAVVSWRLHVVRRNREIAAAALGYRVDEPVEFGLHAPPPQFAWLPQVRYGVLITGASRPQKLWPNAHWLQVARRLLQHGLSLVWFWGSEQERHRAQSLASELASEAAAADASIVVPPFVGVADAASVLSGAELVVGLDTGFTHLAGALGRPTIGIFCDFDAAQCAVTGAGWCASFGGVGQVPPVADVLGAADAALSAAAAQAR